MDVELLTFEHEETHDLCNVERLVISIDEHEFYFHANDSNLCLTTDSCPIVMELLASNIIQLRLEKIKKY